jgi:hypothetical protein
MVNNQSNFYSDFDHYLSHFLKEARDTKDFF